MVRDTVGEKGGVPPHQEDREAAKQVTVGLALLLAGVAGEGCGQPDELRHGDLMPRSDRGQTDQPQSFGRAG